LLAKRSLEPLQLGFSKYSNVYTTIHIAVSPREASPDDDLSLRLGALEAAVLPAPAEKDESVGARFDDLCLQVRILEAQQKQASEKIVSL